MELCPIYVLLSVKWSLKGGYKRKFQFYLRLPSLTRGGRFTRGFKYSDLTRKRLVFWKTRALKRSGCFARGSRQSDLTWELLVILENWSLTRGGRNQRLDCD